jgi:two-component system chemotaxis response regulator CheB
MLSAHPARGAQQTQTAHSPIEAVVIGASAGGIEAISILLAALPEDFAPAVVIVIHVPATNDNLLVEVLQPRCALRINEADDKEPVCGGAVYVAPPAYHLLVEPDRSFALSVDPPVNYSRPSIDVLFESAAYAYRERLLGIVLTGANADGADGLARIRAFGGKGWVQNPDTAVASMMPASAIKRAGADQILSLSEMAAELAGLQAA